MLPEPTVSADRRSVDWRHGRRQSFLLGWDATHFLMKTLPRVAAEMALDVLAYNLTRVMNIMGVHPFLTAMRA